MTTILHRPSTIAGTVARPDLVRTAASTRLRDAHLAASECVAGLSLDDTRLWTRVGPWVTALAAAAYELSATVRGGSPDLPATGVPPVVRARELAYAQTRLFEDLEQHPGVSSFLLEASAAEVARLVRTVRGSQAQPGA